MAYISAIDENNFFSHVSGSFQMKATDSEVFVGIAFSDPAVGMYKVLVDIKNESIDVKALWDNMHKHEAQTIHLQQYKLESLIKQ